MARNAVSWFPTPGILYVVQPCTSYEQAMLRLAAGTVIYDVNGWKWGMDSLDSAHISSFEVNDALAYHIAEAHPGVARITFAGHSASGIMASHYAVAAKAPDDPRLAHINFAFVWSNASHLPWLDGTRPISLDRVAAVLGRELTAAENASIDDWPHGLKKLPRYFATTSADDLARRFLGRECWNCYGANDDQPTIGAGAGAPHIAQGLMSRKLRAQEFDRNAKTVARRLGVPCAMRSIEVQDTGHDPLGVFSYRPVLEALYGGPVLDRSARMPFRASSERSL